MRLLIDAGNTRIKWALADRDGSWLHSGALPVGEAAGLPGYFAELSGMRRIRDIRQVWASNVAGEEVARHISALDTEVHFIGARQSQCGVRNGYDDPAQLGSDRWAALIAAWHLVRRSCLVVNCGTATTIDALSAQGEFPGGLILPGVALMQSSLADTTVQLKTGSGQYAKFPQNTADALFSGALQSSCGAIERQKALLGDIQAPVVLSGGAAGMLRPYLAKPVRSEDNLVLQGVMLIAQETDTK